MKIERSKKIELLLKQSSSFDDALKACIKYVMENFQIEYAVVWLIEKKINELSPYYCLCPLDLTNKTCELVNSNLIGNAVINRTIIAKSNYDRSDDEVNEIFKGINISSLVCIPLIISNKTIGCIQFINSKEKSSFSKGCIKICNALKEAFANSDFKKFNYSREDSEIIFQLKDIHKDFTNGEIVTNVLKGVNIDIFAGEFVVLLGPSGCGKTTLLNIIGGMDNPTSGEILFKDTDLTRVKQKDLTNYRKDNIGFVFQSYNLMPNLTAKQNLDLIGELVNNPLDSLDVLKLVGLEDKANNYSNQLSGGQQQRVSIARALVKNPIAIMADEPTAALDYKTSIGVLDVLQNVTKEGKTLIMVTHNEEISKLANRVIRLRDGKVYEISINRNPAKAEELIW